MRVMNRRAIRSRRRFRFKDFQDKTVDFLSFTLVGDVLRMLKLLNYANWHCYQPTIAKLQSRCDLQGLYVTRLHTINKCHHARLIRSTF